MQQTNFVRTRTDEEQLKLRAVCTKKQTRNQIRHSCKQQVMMTTLENSLGQQMQQTRA